MRKILAFFPLLFIAPLLSGQLNTRLISHLPYLQDVNDIWGYTAPDGTEYALVGTKNGVSIVSLADPANPEEVQFVPGDNSLWRDLKTFGQFAYVTADQPRTEEGLLVIDLSGLPDQAPSFNWRPSFNGKDTLNTCHNIYIDEFGVAYLAGCNLNRGGIILIDVATKGDEPQLLGMGPEFYAHDVYAQNNRMFSSELNEGRFAVYDVSNKKDIKLLGSSETPFRFTHNAWASVDGRYVFTTDERPNAPVTAYDISDFDNIRELDQYRPLTSIGQGVIPHNVHVKDDFLAISYYTDGARIVDISRPGNLVETAFYDTNDDFSSGFHGAWGLYPFLPSGLLLISDIENGLFVVEVDYRRAAYLEGVVTSAQNSLPVEDVEIEIVSGQTNSVQTDRQGDYQTGLGLSGTFEVIFRHPEYREQRLDVTLVSGEVTELDVQLVPKSLFSINGLIQTMGEGAPVPGAEVVAISEAFTFRTVTDASGRFLLEDVFEGEYEIVAGAWGFFHKRMDDVLLNDNASVTISLQPGYQDDFLFDLGWAATGDASSGSWERGVPDGVRASANRYASPPFDVATDFGSECYVTGNGGGNPGDDDVDNGVVTLTSPVFDLTGYITPVLTYHLWFFNEFGSGSPNDSVVVKLTNGAETITLEVVTESKGAWREQSSFVLSELIELTGKMQLIVESADRAETGNVVEAGFDAFLIKDANSTAIEDPLAGKVSLKAYPNPFPDQITLEYEFPELRAGRAFFRIFNTLGQELERIPVDTAAGTIEIGGRLHSGAYFIVTEIDGRNVGVVKVLKH